MIRLKIFGIRGNEVQDVNVGVGSRVFLHDPVGVFMELRHPAEGAVEIAFLRAHDEGQQLKIPSTFDIEQRYRGE